MAKSPKRWRYAWILWVVCFAGGIAYAALPTPRPTTQRIEKAATTNPPPADSVKKAPSAASVEGRRHPSSEEARQHSSSKEALAGSAENSFSAARALWVKSNTAKAVQGEVAPLVKRMLSSIPGESAFLISLRLGQVVSLRSFVRSSLSRWFGQTPKQGIAQVLEHPTTKEMLNAALSSVFGLRGEALEQLKKMVILSDLTHPILVSPVWISTEKFRDIERLGAVDFAPLLENEQAFQEPLVAWVTIPTQDSRGWVSMFRQVMEGLNKPFPQKDIAMMGLKEGMILEVEKRFVIIEPKEGFVRMAISPVFPSFSDSQYARDVMMARLPQILKQGPSVWRFTPALLHVLHAKTFVGARFEPQAMKKLGVLAGMIEAGNVMPMASKQHKPRLASLYAAIAAEPWAFFSSPKAEFEDLGLALSLENKRLDMVASFTQTGREAYQAGRNNLAPTLRSRAKNIFAEGSLDADIPAILQKLKDAFPWSKGIVDRSLPLGADLWTAKQIKLRFVNGGSLMQPVLLASGLLHTVQAWVEAHPALASRPWLLPRRIKWVAQQSTGQEKSLPDVSLGLALVFSHGDKEPLKRWWHQNVSSRSLWPIRDTWKTTPHGDCWLIGFRVASETIWGDCGGGHATASATAASKSALPSDVLMKNTLHLEPLLALYQHILRSTLGSYRLGHAERSLVASLVPWFSSQRLFGQAMSLSMHSQATPQALWAQVTLQPTSSEAKTPKVLVYKDAALPVESPKGWDRSDSPRRCLAQAQLLSHAAISSFELGFAQLEQQIGQGKSLSQAIERLVACIRQDAALQEYAQRITVFWQGLSVRIASIRDAQKKEAEEGERWYVFPLRVISQGSDRRPIAKAKVIANNVTLGETDGAGKFVGSYRTKLKDQIRLKVVGFGADNYMVTTATPRLQKAADGRVVPQEIVVKAFLRAPPIKPQEETHGEIPLARPIILGSLSKKVIGRIVRRWSSRIRYCYERQLIQHPELTGKLVVFFVINPKGRVQTAKIASSTLQNRRLERCVVSIFRVMRFPAPFGGGIVHVRYPLLFRPETKK